MYAIPRHLPRYLPTFSNLPFHGSFILGSGNWRHDSLLCSFFLESYVHRTPNDDPSSIFSVASQVIARLQIYWRSLTYPVTAIEPCSFPLHSTFCHTCYSVCHLGYCIRYLYYNLAGESRYPKVTFKQRTPTRQVQPPSKFMQNLASQPMLLSTVWKVVKSWGWVFHINKRKNWNRIKPSRQILDLHLKKRAFIPSHSHGQQRTKPSIFEL